MNYSQVSDLLRQASIKTENQFMDTPDSSWQDFPYIGKITGEYIILYQCGPIDHGIYVPGTVSQ